MPLWAQAGLWGFVSGGALLMGAVVGYFFTVPMRIVAAVMAFGSGVLISALTFELMNKAYESGGFWASAGGVLAGSSTYTAANWMLTHHGARHRKRSGNQQPTEQQHSGSGMAIALGALLDGVPEAIVIGLSLLEGTGVSLVAVVAVFLSNIPEGLSSAVGMKKAGRSAAYIFTIWGGLTVISALAAVAGYTIFGGFSSVVIAVVIATAAGAILTMIVDTMIPEAFEFAHNLAGLITVVGFLASFALSKLT